MINEVIISTTKKGINRIEEMRKIEGSGYGCPLVAFFDGIFIFLQKYFVSNFSRMLNMKRFVY